MRWEVRYSSSEMMYLEVGDGEVRCWLDHERDRPDVWSFDEVLAGDHDSMLRGVFGDDVLAALVAAVRSQR